MLVSGSVTFGLKVTEKKPFVGWVGDIFGRFYPPWNQQLHSVRTRNTGVGRWVSFWEGLLPRAMLVLGSVPWEIIIFNHQFGDYFLIFPNHRRSKSRKASCRCWVWYVWIYMQTHTELASRCTCFQASRECPLIALCKDHGSSSWRTSKVWIVRKVLWRR